MLYLFFKKAMDTTIEAVVSAVPQNLRQYYADQLLLMRVQIEFGR